MIDDTAKNASADLDKAMRSRSAAERIKAVHSIASASDITDDEKRQLLIRLLQDHSNLVVAASAQKLVKLPAPVAVAPLMEAYWRLAALGAKTDPGCHGRVAIMPALLQCQAIEAGELCRHAIGTYQPERTGNGMDDTATPLRVQAAVVMATLRLKGALVSLSQLLFDVEPRIPYVLHDRLYIYLSARVAAAQALAVLGEGGAVAVFAVKLLQHKDELAEVLVASFDALVELDAAAALLLIEPFLHHEDAYITAGAATALAGLPTPHCTIALGLLGQAAAAATPGTAEALTLAIASVRCDGVVEVLAKLADHLEPHIRTAAITALTQRNDAKSREVLSRL